MTCAWILNRSERTSTWARALTITLPKQKLYKSFAPSGEGTVYDLHFDKEAFQWRNWLKTVDVRL